MPGPLADLRVVDLTQVLSGPFCTMLLADLGADVIKVEPPTGDVARLWGPFVEAAAPGEGSGSAGGWGSGSETYGGYFASINRNKRSVVLDLKNPAGRDAMLDLLAGADVLVENFRAGVMERFGLAYETLHERFPTLVYASIRGFGDPRTGESPYVDWPAFDIIAQAMGGLMGVTGPDPETPVKVGPGIGDVFPAVLSAVGILAAVRHADATGEGQLVDVAMYDAVLALCERIVYQHSITGHSPVPQGNTHPILCPYGLVRTADGFVTIAAPSDHHWRLLVELIGRSELAADERFATNQERLARAAEVYGLVEEWSRARSTDDVVAHLAGQIPCGPVNSAAEIATDPHVAARQMVVQVPHPLGGSVGVVGSAIKLTETPVMTFVPAPLLGAHTDVVMRDGWRTGQAGTIEEEE